MTTLDSLLLPFRSQPPPPRLRQGYGLVANHWPDATALNRLLELADEPPRSGERWQLVLERSLWHLGVIDPGGQLVGFVRATSDRALNANLWDLVTAPADPARDTVIRALVVAALDRLRRELSGCSISISAPAEAIAVLQQAGFVIDPGGIRAMGLVLSGRAEIPTAGDQAPGVDQES